MPIHGSGNCPAEVGADKNRGVAPRLHQAPETQLTRSLHDRLTGEGFPGYIEPRQSPSRRAQRQFSTSRVK